MYTHSFSGKNTYAANYVDGARPSIVFEVRLFSVTLSPSHSLFQVPPPRNGKIDIDLNTFFACNDSCGEFSYFILK